MLRRGWQRGFVCRASTGRTPMLLDLSLSDLDAVGQAAACQDTRRAGAGAASSKSVERGPMQVAERSAWEKRSGTLAVHGSPGGFLSAALGRWCHAGRGEADGGRWTAKETANEGEIEPNKSN